VGQSGFSMAVDCEAAFPIFSVEVASSCPCVVSTTIQAWRFSRRTLLPIFAHPNAIRSGEGSEY
jgi:hypothetical protein